MYRAIFARPIFLRWNTALLTLALRGVGVLNYESPQVSGEKYLLDVHLPLLLPRCPVVFDVGAYVGEYSQNVLEAFPDARIHAFEPQPVNRQKFRIQNNASVMLHPYALGSISETATLFDRADHEGSSHASLYSEVITDLHDQEVTSRPVSVITLDEFCRAHGIESIDLLKIDVEGHEYAVLSGGREMILRRRVRIIQFEFNEMNVVTRTFMRDFRLLLDGFELFRLLPRGLVPVGSYPLLSEVFGYQNIVAVLQERGES